MRTKSLYSLLGLILAVTAACRKQLDTKPSSRLEEPTTATDFQAIMDYANIYSSSWPYAGTAGADEGFVTDATWQAAALTARNAYIWDRNVFNDQAQINDLSKYTLTPNDPECGDGTVRCAVLAKPNPTNPNKPDLSQISQEELHN